MSRHASVRELWAVSERLEPRTLLATLFLNGTEGDDRMSLTKINDTLGAMGEPGMYFVYYLNQQLAGTWFAEDFGVDPPVYSSVVMNGLGGDDEISHSNYTVYTTNRLRIHGGSGNDVISLNNVYEDLYEAEVWGEGGSDRLEIWEPVDFYDEFNIHASEFRIDSTNRNCHFYGVENVEIELTGDQDSTINITGQNPGVGLTVYCGEGNNDVHVGGFNLEANINGLGMNIYTEGGTDTVRIQDTAGVGNDEYTLVSNGLVKPGVPLIFFPHVERLELNANPGNNVIDLPSLADGVAVTLNGTGGNDHVTIGEGDLDAIQGSVYIADSWGQDTITLRDEDDASVRTYGLNYYTVSRTGIDAISFTSATEYLSLLGGTKSNTYNIASVSPQMELTITAQAGNDWFRVGYPGNTVTSIVGAVNAYGGDGTDLLSYNDQDAPTSSGNYDIPGNVIRRGTTGPVAFFDMESYQVHAHDGASTFSITALGSLVNSVINGNGGNDLFEIAKSSGNITATIRGALTLNGNQGDDILSYYDDDDTGEDDYVVSNLAITKTATALPTRTVRYDSIRYLNLFANASSNDITVETLGSVPLNVATELVISAGGGDDQIIVGTGDLGQLNGPILAVGGDGADQLLLRDQNNTTDVEHDLSNNYYVRDAQTFLSHLTVESLRLDAGAGDSTFNVTGLAASAATINAGAGSDTINVLDEGLGATAQYLVTPLTVQRAGLALTYGSAEHLVLQTAATAATAVQVNGTAVGTAVSIVAHPLNNDVEIIEADPASPVTVDVGAGDVNVRVNVDGVGTASVLFDRPLTSLGSLILGNGGLATIAPGGSRVLHTQQLKIAANGRLNLNDNEVAVDPPGSPSLSALLLQMTSYVVSGRAGGMWDGPGVTSSLAAAAPANRVVGVGTDAAQTTVRARLTVAGDANLDGSVDVGDLGILATNWQQSGRTFSQGNFDYSADGLVNVNDLGILATNWQQTLTSPDASQAPRVSGRSSLPPLERRTALAIRRVALDVL